MSKINLEALVLYDNIRKDEIVQTGAKIFNEFLYREYIAYMDGEYFAVQRMLLNAEGRDSSGGTYWQNHICRLIAESENPFSLTCEKDTESQGIDKVAAREMEELKKLYYFDWRRLAAVFKDSEASVCTMKGSKEPDKKEEGIRRAMEEEDNRDSVTMLRDYYGSQGCGIFERHDAFLWDGTLSGVDHFDPITFDDLIGYERQKKQLIENTEFFLQGLPANNALLYGDKGTGKSSSVKALINMFPNRKLKLIALAKDYIEDLQKIVKLTYNRGCKFILFIDDLSFEESETGYKYFKSVMEGGPSVQPDNLLFYVTSNRRNIIKETWKDRSADGEVHTGDGMQERLSLADRFGLSLIFPSPDKFEYLSIVKELAAKEGLAVAEEELEEAAIKWELRHNGRSGRAARHFIKDLTSRLELEKK